MKDYTIAVAGTGYVGLSIATLLSQHHKVLKCCPWAGDIDSFEAFTILTEDGTTVQP